MVVYLVLIAWKVPILDGGLSSYFVEILGLNPSTL